MNSWVLREFFFLPVRRSVAGVLILALVCATQPARAKDGDLPAASPKSAAPAPAKPALTVCAIQPQVLDWPRTLVAFGNVTAWQEAVIGAELSNFRLAEVLVNVGDQVAKGQLLAQVAPETVTAELAQSKAAVAEADAALAEARSNVERARQLEPSGAITKQQTGQYLTIEQTAIARLDAARARVQVDELRLAHTRIVAPDEGVISARAASVGALVQPGQELFRLIRGNRLEWRAEVTSAELARLQPGTPVAMVTPNGEPVKGRLRMVGPTVDPQTRNGLVYVDVESRGEKDAGCLRAGMFVRGEFELGRAPALTLPQAAVLLREGFAYVFRLEGDSRVVQTKVTTGRRAGDRLEVLDGIGGDAQVVASGVGFLTDGDTVRCVASPNDPPAQPAKVK
ncbi:MAG: efflux RND transporter periplasmic adaptor subunit [bacterium]